PYFEENGITIYAGDVREILPALPAESVHCAVTSPPYWGLRNYGISPSVWDGDPACEHRFEFGAPTSETNYVDKRRWQHTRNGRDEEQPTEKRVGWKRETIEHGQFCRCGAWQGCFGLEPSPELYVEHGVQVFREVRRVLRGDGTLWLNIGDSYANDGKWGGRTGGKHVAELHGEPIGGAKRNTGLKAKDLVGIPWMLAFALRADGWYLRSDIIWAKPNPMPESVTDRPTKSHEYLFLLAKSEKYYYDAEAIKEESSGLTGGGFSQAYAENQPTHGAMRLDRPTDNGTRNKRSVWTVATQPMSDWTRTSHRVRVELDAVTDDTERITSPNCPVHGDCSDSASTVSQSRFHTERIAEVSENCDLAGRTPLSSNVEDRGEGVKD